MSDVEDTGLEPKYQVGPETWLEVRFQARDAEGELVQTETECLGFVFGVGRVFTQVEQALEGHCQGYQCEVAIPAHEAFGERDESLLLCVDRDEFPADVRPGDRFDVEDAGGARLVLRVVDVGDDAVQVDLNHPLAGQTVHFHLEILAVRPARLAEIDAAEQDLAGHVQELTGLVAPESLLRQGGRRYESAPRKQDQELEPGNGSGTEEKKA